MTGRRSVWLVGMMGAGKSTVGPALARSLGRRFIDSDQEIEGEAGRSISEIFDSEGEAAFRRRERATIEAFQGQGAVVALGGGAVAQDGMRELLARDGIVVYLRARPERLLERIGEGRTRPLLAGLDARERLARLQEILALRREAYESAEIVIDTDLLPVDELVVALAARLAAEGEVS